jgi:hypothetical protein
MIASFPEIERPAAFVERISTPGAVHADRDTSPSRAPMCAAGTT